MPFDGVVIPRDNPTIHVLQKAMGLVQNGWCQRAYGRLGFLPVSYQSRLATRFCVSGAILRAAQDLRLDYEPAQCLLQEAVGMDIVNWNDKVCRCRETVIAGIHIAINIERERLLQDACLEATYM